MIFIIEPGKPTLEISIDNPVVRPWRRRWRHRRRRRRPIAQRRSAACRLPLARSAVERASEREGGVNVTPRRPEHGFARREQNEPEIFALSRPSSSLRRRREEEKRSSFSAVVFLCFLFLSRLTDGEARGEKQSPLGSAHF